MIKQVVKQMEKQPVTWLALGASVIAGAVVAHHLSRSPERQREMMEGLHKGVNRAQNLGSELWAEGRHDAKAVQESAQKLKAQLDNAQTPLGKHNMQAALSNHEGAIAAFLATLLAKGTASYFEWRSTQKARADSDPTASTTDANSETLENMTVVELRKQASERDIEGRSSMNKDELVDALQSDTHIE